MERGREPGDDNQGAPAIRWRGKRLLCSGEWTAIRLGATERALSRQKWPAGEVTIDLGGMAMMDTAGALLLHRTRERLIGEGRKVTMTGLSPAFRSLLELVAGASIPRRFEPPPRPGVVREIGAAAVALLRQVSEFLALLGESALAALPLLIHPHRFRWRMMLHHLEAAGYRALPIIGLLSFLLGVVIAYQGGVQLRLYGANVYIADLVGIAMLRELAPLMTAIIVAGRTGSAFTAQIGTMRVTDEIDALRSLGIEPLELLVLPRVAALVIALPLLTVFADLMGLAGGLLVAAAILDLTPAGFLERVTEAVSLSSYLIGVGKAPVFAAIIATVGCFQGLRVRESAESVGRQTTVSVVQSIFLVIVVDAGFSVIFSELGL